MRRLLFAACAFGLLATPALAAAPKGDKADEPPHLDLRPVALPLLLQGRVVNYAFVHLRLVAPAGADENALRPHEPFIRDAVVRAAHRAPVNAAGSLTAVDEGRLAALALAEGRRRAGAKAFISAAVTRQEPKKVRGLPAIRPPA